MTKDDWDVISSGKMLTLEETVNDREYTTIKFPVSLGERHLLAGYAIDITERKRTEGEKTKLEVMNRQLQKAESLSRMAGAIAHHFNNKLHVVMGNLELAKEGMARGETSISNLTAAMLAADQAVEVSRLLLIYLGQVTDKQEPLDLSEVCRNALSTLRAGAPKAVKIETILPSPGPSVRANAKQIQQILNNLVTNAWESADDAQQCTIHLSTGTVSPADIPTSHRFPIQWQPCRDSYACLEVRDNGCGITEEALEEVFSPFFSTKFTGRGLGLPMVLGLTQAHGGVVTVETTLGHGSIFRVFLPISTESVPHAAIVTDKTAEIPQAATVLLVDDEDIVVEITSRMLSMLGFTVLSASDGPKALELFRQHRADIRLVLSDVSMPLMNGLETLTALRKIAPDIPVILASGYSEEQVMDGTHLERPQAFLKKPYGFDALRDAIRRSLTNSSDRETSSINLPQGSPTKNQGDTQ